MSRDERIKKFVVNEATTVYVYTADIERIGSDLEFEATDLLNYHRAIGSSYKMNASLVDAQAPNSCLQLQCAQGGGWNDNQRDLNDQLQYVPLPDDDLRGRDGVLVLKKSIADRNIKLGTTDWTVVNSYIRKMKLDAAAAGGHGTPDQSGFVEVNDVVILWKHDIWNSHIDANGDTPNIDKYVVSCWKWLS